MYSIGRLIYSSLCSLLVDVLVGLPSKSFFKFLLILVFLSDASPLKPMVYSERRWVSKQGSKTVGLFYKSASSRTGWSHSLFPQQHQHPFSMHCILLSKAMHIPRMKEIKQDKNKIGGYFLCPRILLIASTCLPYPSCLLHPIRVNATFLWKE